jgi:hypothetical protein
MLSVLRRATLHVELVTGCSRVPSARCVMDSQCVSHATIAFSVLRMIYMIASPLVRECGQISEVLVRHVLRAKAPLADYIREAGGGRAPATGTRRGSGPKRNRCPAGKFEGTLVQVHCPKKKGMGLPRRSRCVSRALDLSVSLALRRVLLPLSLSLSLSAGEF